MPNPNPSPIRRIDNLWIPMADGARLAARLWLPLDAEAKPVPAILEYIPYRKGDFTTLRDETIHPALAAQGYACIRVDMRGAGESDGVLDDEYSQQERDDGVAVIAWIAAQPWCSGRVGMMGISWGGITALQMAARRPPALKAIIPVGACDDRYYDDGGYYMGCLNGETIGWAAIMFGYNTRPPDPAVVGERWRALWLERLETCPHYLEHWLAHQQRDDYWRAGSVCEDYGAIEIPVYGVSGWADCWPNTVPRLLERLSAPCKGLMGPWCHRYPHMGIPGPAIDFLDEARRWFDHWLKDRDGGIEGRIMDEPAYRAWIMESVPPRTYYGERPGRWVAEGTWPSPHIEQRRLALNRDGLAPAAGPETALTVCSPQTVGLASGEYMPWFAFGPGAELPGDQRPEDAGSLVFDGPVLDDRLEILGQPVATLEVASDRRTALAAVRLCDVAPDGASTLVTRGIVNLAQRNGRERPEPLQPGERTRVTVGLDHVGYAFPAGHRIRLAVSTCYWPMAWPVPEPVTLTLFAGGSHLELPVRAPRDEDRALSDFPAPQVAPPRDRTVLRPHHSERRLRRDLASGECALTIEDDNGAVRLEDSGLEFGSTAGQRYTIQADDPLSARAEYVWTWDYGRRDWGRGDWRVRTRTRTLLTATAESFVLNAELEAWEGEEQVSKRSWKRAFPRHLF